MKTHKSTLVGKVPKSIWLGGWMAVALSGTLHAQISDGLVSYWPLDEIQGTKTPDLVSFYDMDVTNLEAGDVVAGRHGNAFSFDNARQTLLSRVHDAGDDLPANKHRSHTISMWVNVVGEGQNDLRIFSEGNTENSNPLFNIGTHNGGADGSVDFYLRQSGWSTFGHAYSEQQPFDGNWHHIAWVQEDGARTFYVDGVADSLEIPDQEEGDWLVNNTSIGGILRASASHWSTGVLDDVAIWKRALSASEVAELATSSVSDHLGGGGSDDPVAEGLVSHWPLDAIQGTKTPDVVSGYDMDITNLTADDVVPGKNGNAFSFDNARQTLLSRVHDAGDDLPANKHAAHTISMWVNVVGEGQNDLRVFSEGNTENSNPLFNIGTHNGGADGSVDFYIRQSGWTTFGHAYSEQQPFDGTWHHIVWVQEADGSRVLYVDGIADSLEITPKEEGDWLVNNTSIGGILRASASHWSTGLIDDVAIWKRALSADEVASVGQNGVPSVSGGSNRPPGLVSHWPLDEIQGTKTPDVVSGYDMDISNLTASDVVPGKNGNAFSFDNARQTLLSRVHEADDDLPANKHASHTITMWVNVVGEGQNDLRVFSEGNTENSNPLFNIGTHNGGADGSVDFYLRQSGWTTFGHAYSEQQPFDGSWHHIAWVQDERSRTFYVDGVADSLEIPDQEEGDWLVNNTSIGGILRASASHWSTGLVDDVAIWKRALSADEINNVIQNGVPKVTSGNLRPLGIAAFGAEFTGAAKGDSVVLTWDASADASLSINRGVGDVTAASEFGVGSIEVQVEESTTFTLTASRGNEQVTSSVHVTVYDGVADGWSLIQNFETMEQSSVNGQLRWKNPEGTTQVVDTENDAFGQALTLQGSALSAILLGSKTILEGEKATLFFRMYGTEADELGIQANVGLSEKPIRFIGDFDNEVGPFVQMSDIEGFGLDIYAIDGFQGAAEWSGTTVDYDEVYNVWMHVDNRSVEDGDKFTVFIQQVGGERVEAFKDYTSDRNPAGSVDLGLPGPDLDTLFVSSHNGALVAGQFMVDDFYISRGGFNDTEPHAPGAVTVIPESDNPDPEPAALVAEGSASEPTVVDFGALDGDASYVFYFTAIKGGASTAIAGDNAFAIKLDQWNEQGLFGTTQFGVADNLFAAVDGQSVASIFDTSVHTVFVSDSAAGETHLYINGVLSGTWDGSIPLSGQVKVMGARLEQATDHMAAGSTMHAWAAYSGKLSAGEIQSLYANRPEVVDGPTVAILSLDGVPAEGSGLDGRYWQSGPKTIDNILDRGGDKDIGLKIITGTRPTGVFKATGLTFQGGTDITPVQEWLGADADSYVGGDGDMNDGILSFTGYVRIDNPGEVDIRSESDDGSIVWIAGTKVVDNDGGHGAPGPSPDGSYNFTAPGLYPIEIAWYNGNWTNDAGDHGGANLKVLAGGSEIPGAILYSASDVAAASIAASSAAEEVGDAGLHAAYWTTGPKGLQFGEDSQGPIFSFVPGDDHGLGLMETNPQGRFISSNVNYAGTDISPILEWLGDDAGSFVGTEGELNDGLIQFKGYVAIDEAGLHTFRSASDDGSVVFVGNQVVVNNDGGHGAPGPAPDGSAFFPAAGLYPIEVAWFNGNWTNDAGDHGGANIDLTMDGESIAGSIFQPVGGLPAVSAGGISSVALSEGNVVIEYSGTLKSADVVTGPYSAVDGASSPYSVPAAKAAEFFIAE